MAEHYRGYLSGQDRDFIENKIATFFSEESEQIVLKDIQKLKEEVDLILEKVKLIGNKAETKQIARNTIWKENFMAEAYLIIFKLRQFLTGEEIDYRYYYTTPEGKAKAFYFSEKDILKYMRFDKSRLSVSASKLTKTLEEQNYQKILDKHYNNLIAGIQPARESNYQVVHSYIMARYGLLNPGLRNKETNKYQLFNMGHIYEAIDIAFTRAIEADLENDYAFIETLVYGKYLVYDNIEGIKGGDNAITMTQIKSNSAGFLKYHTIIEALKEISQILQGNLSTIELKKKIKDLYISTVKYDDLNACDQMVDDAVQKILDQINKNMKA